MKNKNITGMKIITALMTLCFLTAFGACSKKDQGPTGLGTESGLGQGEATVKLECEPGEFANASGTAKRGLKLAHNNLYHAIDNYYTSSHSPSSQDVIQTASGEFVAKSTPEIVRLFLDGNQVGSDMRTQDPATSVKFVNDGETLYLLVGTLNGLAVYQANSSGLSEMKYTKDMGVVGRMDAQGGNVCIIANSGQAVLKTTVQGLSGNGCTQVVYDASGQTGTNNQPFTAFHVAASNDGCYFVTRSGPAYANSLFGLLDSFLSLVDSSSPEFIDLRGIEDKLIYVSASGEEKEIKPSMGNFDQVTYSDLDSTSDGAVVSFTGFKKSNWDGFSSTTVGGGGWANKIRYLLKLYMEVTGGVIFVSGQDVVRTMDLPPSAVSFNIGGGMTLDAIPNLALPWYPASAVEDNSLLFNPYLGFYVYDISNYRDTNVVNLPSTEYTPWDSPGAGGQRYPSGLVYDIKLSKKRIFTTNMKHVIGVDAVQYTYDFSSEDTSVNPWVIMNTLPAYKPLNRKFNNKITFAGSAGGYTGLDIAASPDRIYFQGHQAGATRQYYKMPATEIETHADFPGSTLVGAPITNPDENQIAWVFLNKTLAPAKMGIAVHNETGDLKAFTDPFVEINDPQHTASLYPGAITGDTLVVGIETSTPSWELYAFHIEGDGSIKVMTNSANNYFISEPGHLKLVKGLREDSAGKFSVVVQSGSDTLNLVTFEHDGTNVSNVDVKTVTFPVLDDVRDVVFEGDNIYSIQKTGNSIIPLTRSDFANPGPEIGKIAGTADNPFFWGMCHYHNKEIYCGGIYLKSILSLFKFNVDTKESTQIVDHHPFLTFYGGGHLATMEMEGPGAASYDLNRPVPEVNIDTANITTGGGSPGGTSGGSTVNGGAGSGGPGSTPMDAAPLGGSGCSLNKNLP